MKRCPPLCPCMRPFFCYGLGIAEIDSSGALISTSLPKSDSVIVSVNPPPPPPPHLELCP